MGRSTASDRLRSALTAVSQLLGGLPQWWHAAANERAGCLTLNVWTPQVDGALRPVMVWIHGGGFQWGTAASDIYDGERFAVDHDVVLVSCNYRLSVLGFTYLGELGGPDFAGSGSLGIKDAAAALRWVAQNIDRFGGDPHNVTIFGESAGAMSVGTLLALPEAHGLFHRAILQSGAASHVANRADAAERTRELLEILGRPRASVADLQSLPVEALLSAHAQLAARHRADGMIAVPVIDGEVLDRRPVDAVAAGSARDIPILVGTNRDEWRLFAVTTPGFMESDAQAVDTALQRLLPGEAARALSIYRQRLPDATPADLLAAANSDAFFRIPAIHLAEAQLHAGGAVWQYLFTWESPQGHGILGACHGLELPFVFNTLDGVGAGPLIGDNPPRKFAADLNATWAAFARHGDPSRGQLGRWPQYDTSKRPTKILNALAVEVADQVLDDPLSDERLLWMK